MDKIYDIEDKKWMLEGERIKDKEEIAMRDFFGRMEEEEQE